VLGEIRKLDELKAESLKAKAQACELESECVKYNLANNWHSAYSKQLTA